MPSARLDAGACQACLHSCTDSVYQRMLRMGDQQVLAAPDAMDVWSLATQIVHLAECRLTPEAMPELASENISSDAAARAVRCHVESVLGQAMQQFRYGPDLNTTVGRVIVLLNAYGIALPRIDDTGSIDRTLAFIWENWTAYLANPNAYFREGSIAEERCQVTSNNIGIVPNKLAFLQSRRRPWSEEERAYLLRVFESNPNVTFTEAARRLNSHFKNVFIDGIPFAERSRNAVRGQIVKYKKTAMRASVEQTGQDIGCWGVVV